MTEPTEQTDTRFTPGSMTPASVSRSTARADRVAVGFAMLVAAVLAVVLGFPTVPLGEIGAGGWEGRVFLQLQLPRVLLGLAAGWGLGLAGAWMQGLMRNPLADPYILGVSGGAAIGSAFGFMLPVGAGLAAAVVGPLAGFLGAMSAFALVLAFGRGGGQSPLRMLLAGVVVNALAGAALMILTTLSDAASAQRTLVRLMGAVGVDPARPWLAPIVVTTVVTAAALLLRPSQRALDLLALGDETARTLGVDPLKLRQRALGLVSIVVGAVVAATGLIGFVGLVIPHAVRLRVGPGHARLVPLSAATAAIAVVLADATVSRLAGHLGSELPVGVATAALGGPLFLWLLARHLRGVAA